MGYLLWNASTGAHSGQYDPHCPLTSVSCVIGKENVSIILSIMSHWTKSEISYVTSLWNTSHRKFCFSSNVTCKLLICLSVRLHVFTSFPCCGLDLSIHVHVP